MKKETKDKKEIKEFIGWAIIDKSSGLICTDVEGKPLIYKVKKWARLQNYDSLDIIKKVKIIIL
jgi:hypothetical protein